MSGLAVVLIGVAAAGVLASATAWAGWVSMTLVRILEGIGRNDTRLDDVERRLDEAGL